MRERTCESCFESIGYLAFLVLQIPLVFVLSFDVRSEGQQPAAEFYGFDDRALSVPIEHPAWFKESFLDLRSDLAEAKAVGKRGLVIYFGQRRCAYCQKLMQVNFALPDVVEYTRAHFDVVAVDVWGSDEVVDVSGVPMTEREFAEREETNFTPSLLFYSLDGELALRLRGYYPPYQFRAALEYVADQHYRRESFRDYLARGDNRMVFDDKDLNDEEFFEGPPHNLDRRVSGERPLVVFFEQGECHACDVLHGQSLREASVDRLFTDLDAVQLNMWSDTPVVTPSGQRMTARVWSASLGLFYAPSIVFFDEQGQEIIRVESVVGFNRLRNVLSYIAGRSYGVETFQQWRSRQGL